MLTLTGPEYTAPEVFQQERERLFAQQWVYAGRSELVREPGDRLVIDAAGESVVVVRDRLGRVHAHHNVCRHRGARLCDETGGGHGGAITCPYHAFSYSLDGALVATPNVGPEELDRTALSLWPVAVAEWEGFVFVSLAPYPPLLGDWLDTHDGLTQRFARFALGELRIGYQTVSEVRANWKILFENYAECLHCPRVHPELVEIIPHYRTGAVIDAERADEGVSLREGANSFTFSGRSSLPARRGMSSTEESSYYGAAVIPTMMIDVTGTSVMVTRLVPRAADHTTVSTEYLFRADAVADPAFDPTEVVTFSELVATQDYAVCERVQRGVGSRAFTHGVFTQKDSLAYHFTQRYRAEMAR